MDFKETMRAKRLTAAKQNATETPLTPLETPLPGAETPFSDRQGGPSSGISGGQEWHLSGISENQMPLPGAHSEPTEGPSPPDPDGITRATMNSNVLGGVVPISWTPDGAEVWVDGIPYTAKEIGELMGRNVDAETMRGVHETKRAFDATIN